MSTKRIRRIDPVQCGKVTAIVTIALLLIIFVPIMLLFSLSGLGSSSSNAFGMFLGGGILMIILVPIIYGVMGFLMGLLYAAIYNATYRFHGGMQLEYDDYDELMQNFGNNVNN